MLRNDPLVHFLVIGALLFAALSWIESSETPAERIVIQADRVAALRRSAELLRGGPLGEAELQQLVENTIRDEVYYRQALALELDVDDDEVRTRLIEKMRYLTENRAYPEPTAAELEAFFTRDPARFEIPALVTFDQVFFSPRMRGESVAAEARAALAELEAGADPGAIGDPTPLEGRFEAADANRVRVLFGDTLTAAVFAAEPGGWLGPYESDFGLHLVRLVERSGARRPELAEVEAAVREAFAAERIAAANEAAYAEIREGFDIAVQWEAGREPEPWP